MPSKLTSALHRKLENHARQRKASRRPLWLGLILVIVTASMVASFALPKYVHAQAPNPALFSALASGIPVKDTGSWIQRTIRNVVDAARWVVQQSDKLVDKVAKKVGDVAFKNALKVFLGQIAEDTATWVASGAPGQGPAFITDPHYFKNLSDAAAGDYLDSLALDQFGYSLCDPGTFKLQIDVALRVNLNPNFCKEACQQNYDAELKKPTPVCTWTAGISDCTKTRSVDGREDLVNALDILKQEEATGGTESAVWYCDELNMSIFECTEATNEALANLEASAQSNLKVCNNVCSAKKRKASCSLSTIQDNISNSSVLLNGNKVLDASQLSFSSRGLGLQEAFNKGDLPKIFKSDQNPLGQFLVLSAEADQAAAAAKQNEKDILNFGGIFPLRALISGKVKTPAKLTEEQVQKKLNPDDPATKQTGTPIADAFGIFTNTLTSKLIERLLHKGIVDDKGNPQGGSFTSGNISTSVGGTQAAKNRFASLSQVSFGVGGGMDILNDLSGCPADVATVTETSIGVVSPNSCVLDPSFRQAIEQRLTVKEALDRGLLSNQKVFGFNSNGQEPDFRNGYPYRSLIILRKYRIVPVGWELAALYIRDHEKQNVNIGSIMNQFDDSTSPYFRLIDPSWVLKAPENICMRTGFTSDVVSNEYTDTDGDEGAKKNLDYTVRYCNVDSDANIGKTCACNDPALQKDTNVQSCLSDYDPNDAADLKEHCVEQGNAKATCSFITPRQQQVQRQQACVDERTCILENEDGSCKQYGSCVEEKDAWRFNGQSCSELYASCQSYTNPSGARVSYLQNTLQKSLCGPDNAGCQQYCTAYNYTTNAWACTAAAPGTKRFDRDLQSCDESGNGCTQFIRQAKGTNLLPNGNFEQSTPVGSAGNANFSGWRTGNTTQTCGAQTFVSTDVVGGSQAARLQWAPDCAGDTSHYFTNGLDTGTSLVGRTFTVSFSAKSESASCNINTEITGGAQYGPNANPTLTPNWQRFSYSYTFKPADAAAVPPVPDPGNAFTLFFRPTNPADPNPCTYIIDNVQVEEGATLTDYKDYGAVNVLHLKRPPSGYCSNNVNLTCESDAACGVGTCIRLQCTGNTATDPAACSKFVTKCTQDDVGCDLFTPVAGGLSVPAKPGMTCPADKVGCASFREQPTTGVLEVRPERTGYYCKSDLPTKFTSCDPDAPVCPGGPADCEPLVSFIGKTGQQCTAQDVGCEAFTNQDDVRQGGEGKAQFTKLQQCVPLDHPPAELGNFYTWVGSEESGYQLKKFSLKRSNSDAGPCTNLGHDLPLACLDNIDPQHPIASCQFSDLGKNPDCAQYYNEAGTVFYRLRSRVIEASANCHPYRNALDSLTYYADGVKSLTCSAAAVGCREYVGNTGSNTHTLVSSNFENGSYDPWTIQVPNSGISPESITYGGHSLRVGTAANGGSKVAWVETIDLISSGSTYVVKFWARSLSAAANTLNVHFDGPMPYVADVGTLTLGTDWNEYTLGPITYDAAGVDPSSLVFTSTSGQSYYLDNVQLIEVTDSVYKIKASQTPCGGFEGCQAYRNRAGQVVNYQGFTKLCKSEKVGCEALINTQNSSDPFQKVTTLPNLRGDLDGNGKINQADVDYLQQYLSFGGPAPYLIEDADINDDASVNATDLSLLTAYVNGTNPTAISRAPYDGDTVVTPRDAVEYWVNDSAKACPAEVKGCKQLGRQTLVIKQSGGAYVQSLQNTELVYAKDDPDTYGTILCGKEALSCDEFETTEGGTTYFRNPDQNVCSYKDASAGVSAGWYIEGTNTPCPTRNLNHIPPSVPTSGFAGLCPAEQSGCGLFLDPFGTGESISTNADFELPSANPPVHPQGWFTSWCSNDVNRTCAVDADCGAAPATCNASTALQAREDRTGGSKAVRLTLQNRGNFRQSISLNADTNYVLSAEVQRSKWCTNNHDQTCTVDGECGAGTCVPSENPIRLGLANCRDAQNSWVSTYSPDQSMLFRADGASLDVPADRFPENTFTRVSGRFFSGTAVTCQVYAGSVGAGAGQWFDKLQVNVTTSSPVLRQSVDSKSCNGQVGDKLGCRLFNDTSSAALSYDVDQSPVGSRPMEKDATGAPANCISQPESCDSNVLLKVTRDRVCSKWLAPTTTVETTKPNGTKENLTVGIATCDSFSPSGQCNRFVDEKRCTNNPKQSCTSDAECGSGTCKPMTVTGDSPSGGTAAYTREDLRNKSGLVIAGFEWSPDKKITGMYPVGIAPQVGGETSIVDASEYNGNFDRTTDVRTSGWIMDPLTETWGGKLSIVSQETLGTGSNVAPVSVDPYLLFDPGTGQQRWPAIRTSVASLGNKLSAGKSYYISFKARYMSPPESATYVDAGISFGDDSNSSEAWEANRIWFNPLQISDQWKTYVVGPLRLDKGATTAEGNSVGALHEDFDPSKGFVFFTYVSDKRESTPKLAIDSVSILPVLQVRDAVTHSWQYPPVAGDVFIPRTCRAYPSSSALSCNYSDDTGKQFVGWQGYCLQVDPKNANNCISWYPVDILSGDRNVFGKVEAAGYTQRSPLYMCLESNGGARLSRTLMSYEINEPEAWGINYLLPSDGGIGYSLNEVESMYVRVTSSNRGYPAVGTVLVANRNGGQYLNGGLRTTADPWFVGGCTGSACTQTYTWEGVRGQFGFDGSNNFDSGRGADACDNIDGSTDNTNLWAVKLYWTNDPNNRVTARSYYGLCDASGGNSQLGIEVKLVVRGMCTNVVRVVTNNGQNRAWSSRTASAEVTVPNLLYKRGQDASPFGGAVSPETNFNDPTLWDTKTGTQEDGRQPLYVMSPSSDPRAGTVYGCHIGNGSDCSLRVCSTTGLGCTTRAEIAACADASNGICLGAGPALTCQAGTRVGQACSTDADCGTGNTCDYGAAQVRGGGVAANNQPLIWGIDRLKTLFANVYESWTLNFNYAGGNAGALTYALVTPGPGAGCNANCVGCTNDMALKQCTLQRWQNQYRDMPLCGMNGTDRAVIDTNPAAAYCGNLPEVKNVSVGKTTSGDVIINSGEVLQLSFNSVVDKEQLPLHSIAIDWDGDTQIDPLNDQIVQWGFAPRSDPADPHVVSHVFRFGVGFDPASCYRVNEGPDRYRNNPLIRGHAYCIAHPQVQIRDNWSWCSFNGTAATANEGRCLTNYIEDDPDYWTPFGGSIIVIR